MIQTTPLKLTCEENLAERHMQIAKGAVAHAYAYLDKNLPIQHEIEINFEIDDAKAWRGFCRDSSHVTIKLPSNMAIGSCSDGELQTCLASVVIRTLFCAKHELIEHAETPFQRVFLEGIASHHEINYLGQTDPILYHMRKAGLVASTSECRDIYMRFCAYLREGNRQKIDEFIFDVPDFADSELRPLGTKLGYYLLVQRYGFPKIDVSDFATMKFDEIFTLVPTAPFETLPRK